MANAVLAPPGSDVRATLDRLLDADPAVADRDEIAVLVSTVAKMRGWLDAYEVRCARRTGELAVVGRSEPVGSMFARAGQRSGKDAAKVADRNTVCDQLDAFEVALVDGRISAGHLDGVAAAMRDLDDVTRAEFVDGGTRTVRRGAQRECRHVRSALPGVVPASRGVTGDVGCGGTRSATGCVERETVGRQGHRDVSHPCRARPDPRRGTVERHRRRTRPPAAHRRQRRHPVEPAEGQRVRRRGHQRRHPTSYRCSRHRRRGRW